METVVPSSEIPAPALGSGEQLCVLLGFRTTDDNCVDTAEADSERSQVGCGWWTAGHVTSTLLSHWPGGALVAGLDRYRDPVPGEL